MLTGPTLERAIVESRNTAINGSLPIPPNVRRALTGYIDEDALNRARFKIGDNGFINLARLIEQGGQASAVTLIDVIVFRGPSEANDLSLWAHELTHVGQYAACSKRPSTGTSRAVEPQSARPNMDERCRRRSFVHRRS
ncbi:DUF4157 domain-containing protein [Bradyrhizobium sp. Pa8]|uniref:eCIS core domain-containing protein n=1 Tax=Bradyrhizobium sp. Pa8 TaxID=3386552 RepID=UPI00403F014B